MYWGEDKGEEAILEIWGIQGLATVGSPSNPLTRRKYRVKLFFRSPMKAGTWGGGGGETSQQELLP